MKIILSKTKNIKNSIAKISNESGIPRLLLEDLTIDKEKFILINWGYNNIPDKYLDYFNVINIPDAKQSAVNKLMTLKILDFHDIPCVEFTTDLSVAEGWIESGHVVYCRTLLTSSKGKGIVIAESQGELIQAKFYTKQFKGTGEYRIHVGNGRVIDYTIKKATNENPDIFVRNFQTGWNFSHNCELPDYVGKAGVDSINAIGLHFGAVDIINNSIDKTCAVLEINTCPGLTIKKTITAYSEYFKSL